MPVLNAAGLNTSIDAFKEVYERLVSEGIDASVVVIAMSELIAFCLAHKAATGGGDELAFELWLRAFKTTYRDHLAEAKKR